MEIKILNIKSSKNIFYEVKKDETFESVADAFSLPVEYLRQNNPGKMYKGKILFLPETDFVTYVVKPFDTLQSIASNFGTTIDAIKQKNSLSSDYVFIGQKIFI